MVEITLVQGELKMGERAMNYHSSEIIDLHLTKCSSKTLNNLLYFMYWKPHSVFFFSFFIWCNFIYSQVYVSIDQDIH